MDSRILLLIITFCGIILSNITVEANFMMTRDSFKLIHSELIMQVQLIENDLRLIYAAMKSGNFEDNLDDLDKANLGRITKELKDLDYSDGHPDLSKTDYDTIDRIREIRNYWCHQCYLDYVYIQDDFRREQKFQEIAARLSHDENLTWDLHEKLEKLRHRKLKEYNRI